MIKNVHNTKIKREKEMDGPPQKPSVDTVLRQEIRDPNSRASSATTWLL